MWRRYGDTLYEALVLAGFVLQAVVLGLLTWTFVPTASRLVPVGPQRILLTAVLALVTALLATTGFVLGYHSRSRRREERRAGAVGSWTQRWAQVAFGKEPPPPAPLSDDAVEALLALREQLDGPEGRRVDRLLDRFLDPKELARPLSSRRLPRRLDALERIARARAPGAFYHVLSRTSSADLPTRIMATRALARGFARFPEGPARGDAAMALVGALDAPDLPVGIVLEALVLLEGSASSVIRLILDPGREVGERLRWAAIEAAGRLRLEPLADDLAHLVGDGDPEIRAAALRALDKIGRVPASAHTHLRGALHDEVEFVRVQASRAFAHLPAEEGVPALWDRLGDESWWVRRTAAETLLRLQPDGAVALGWAARVHQDRYARHMAVQALFDAKFLDAETARKLREAA